MTEGPVCGACVSRETGRGSDHCVGASPALLCVGLCLGLFEENPLISFLERRVDGWSKGRNLAARDLKTEQPRVGALLSFTI